MIDRERLERPDSTGRKPRTAALRSPTGRLGPSQVVGGLPHAANRRIFGVQQPGSGEIPAKVVFYKLLIRRHGGGQWRAKNAAAATIE
jgi:hypothetical protein